MFLIHDQTEFEEMVAPVAAYPNLCSIQSAINQDVQQEGDDPCGQLRDCSANERRVSEATCGILERSITAAI